jgi:hypothetical protein
MKQHERTEAIGCLVVFIAFSGIAAFASLLGGEPLWFVAWIAYWSVGLGGWRLWRVLGLNSTVGFGSEFGVGEGAAASAIFWPWTLIICGGELALRIFLDSVIPKDDDPGD